MAEVLTELCKMILPFQTIQKELKRKQNSLVAPSRKNFDDFTNCFENERLKFLKPEMLFILNILQSVKSNSKDHPSLAAYCEHLPCNHILCECCQQPVKSIAVNCTHAQHL